MKLMTAEIRKKMPAFGVTDGTPPLADFFESEFLG